jgi:hypothetical protein
VIDITVPEKGQQPRELVLAVLNEVFDEAMELTQPGATPPQLRPSYALARAAGERGDVEDLIRQLRRLSVAAIATVVRVRTALTEEDHDAHS